MRARIAFVILGTALLGLGIFPAEARNIGGGAATGHFARVMPGRSFIVPRHFNRFGFTDRFGFTGRGQFAPFGSFNGFGGFDGFAGNFGAFDGSFGLGSPGVVDTPPSVGLVPQSTQLGPPQTAANLPPCHEMTPAGVAIDRGMRCSRAPQ